ncbi:MAG: hypothetical protein JF592_18565 [Microbacterium sp.]|uniref:hypothetical protein n=1 Tax=Microbacterium sp. TaxID=51671 RepID=UPI001D59EE5B|nr:hypothetical protein [Microbacterium sp.]MBW8764553.1 hypothetical protein [Microbacterium sp.]
MTMRTSFLLLAALGSLGAAENLVLNGDFEAADPSDATRPKAWGRIDGLGVRWAPAPPDATGVSAGKALRFDTAVSEQDMVARWKAMGSTEWDVPDASKGPIGATYGLSLYSDAIPITAATPYLVTVRHRGPGGGKVWVRGYAKRGDAMKRVYEAQTELPAGKDWRATTYAFDPTRHTPQVTEVKIMLFAYWPAAESWFDDVGLRVATPEELAAEDARKKR